MLSLVRALAFFALLVSPSVAAIAATTASPVREATSRHITLLDYARARSSSARAFNAQPLERFVPAAVMAPEAAQVLRSTSPDAYLLYVSAIAPSGAGSVNVYPGWVHTARPPLIGKISGLDSPSSLAVDRFGTLYVCQTDVNAPVLVFPFLSREPARKLKTEGTLPVSVAVAPNGTVYVSTAQNGSLGAAILVYPPGATSPAMHFDNLAGDAVSSLQSDDRGDVYFAAVSIGSPGYIGELAARGVHRFLSFSTDDPVSNIELDAVGNVLALSDSGGLTVYSHASGKVLERLNVPEFQSLGFSNTHHAFYASSGEIAEYAYPSGKRLYSITSLAADDTFGLATFPRAPYPLVR
jgi:hypothetical protein